MLKNRPFLVFLINFFWISSVWAQVPLDSEQIISPSIGQKFYEIAYELANSESFGKSETEQAIIFLNATMNLDPSADYVYPLLLRLTSQRYGRDYSELVNTSLMGYLNRSADLEPVEKAVQYLLQGLNFREQREQLLKDLLENLGGKNDYFDSEVNTLLGLLMLEKTDNETAKSYFMQAFEKNKYNKIAFTNLVKIAPEQVTPTMYLEHLRLVLGENPFDLESVSAFARYAEQIQLYQTAADTYKYAAELFNYLYPSQQLPSSIYIPWMLSNYNTRRSQYKCLQIASKIRLSGRFDLSAEAIAVRAAEKIGDIGQASRIRQAVEEKIRSQSSLPVANKAEGISSLSIAWFYCFASPDMNEALDWANKAYSEGYNSEIANAVLAYALVMNNQIEWAKPLINDKHSQIADLTLALIQLSEGQEDLAVETLKSAIAKDPSSLAAEKAREILSQHGEGYGSSIDPNTILVALIGTFGQEIVPEFIKPEKVISAKLNTRGTEFSYGNEFGGTVTITNNSSEPLVVSEDGLFTGNIRVDASLTGDLNKVFPKLVSMKIKPSLPVKPGQSIFIPLRLFTGELRRMLLTYPQASLEIEFTLYLDPVVDDKGRVTNRVKDLEPSKLTIRRPRTELTARYLRQRINSLRGGQQGQKIQAAQLFIGLLMEQHAMANSGPLYKFMYADWMPGSLKLALVRNLTDSDWIVKALSMTDMTLLPLDYKLIRTLSDDLNDKHWPVRLMAVYLMAENQPGNFERVLDWTAENDSNEFVRNMTTALGGTIKKLEDQDARPPSISYSY